MNLLESENQYVEFKQSFNAAVIETLVAFANSKGGTVYVGVEDNGKVKGLSLGKETVAQIVNEIKFKTIPALIPDAEVVESAGHFVFYNPGRLPENITVEDLLANTYKSTPRNKQIADFCKDLGIIEKYGSGIRRILDYFREEKLKLPVLGNISDGFMVTVFGDRVSGTIGGTIGKWLLGQSPVSLEGVKERIIQIMIENSFVTVRQLSSMLDMNKSAMQRHIDALKKRIYWTGRNYSWKMDCEVK